MYNGKMMVSKLHRRGQAFVVAAICAGWIILGAYSLYAQAMFNESMVTIEQHDHLLLVHQPSAHAIMYCETFDIAESEAVKIFAAETDAVTIIQVTGQKQSVLDGRLFSNGHVILINPNGFRFSVTARFHAAGISICAMDVKDGGAMPVQFGFDNTGGIINNQGQLYAQTISMAAGAVRQAGLLQAREVNLAAFLTDPAQAGSADALHHSGFIGNSGTINCSGLDGGRIMLRGTRIELDGRLLADGQVGNGGSIGCAAEKVLVIQPGSLTSVCAGQNGDGGVISLHSTGYTFLRPDAILRIHGGQQSGKQGQLSISSAAQGDGTISVPEKTLKLK